MEAVRIRLLQAGPAKYLNNTDRTWPQSWQSFHRFN